MTWPAALRRSLVRDVRAHQTRALEDVKLRNALMPEAAAVGGPVNSYLAPYLRSLISSHASHLTVRRLKRRAAPAVHFGSSARRFLDGCGWLQQLVADTEETSALANARTASCRFRDKRRRNHTDLSAAPLAAPPHARSSSAVSWHGSVLLCQPIRGGESASCLSRPAFSRFRL